MARYYIESIHFVHEDDFQEGEGEQVNSYDLNTFINADSVNDAIQKYIEDYLGFSFSWDNVENSEDNSVLDYYELVDNDNIKASTSEIEKWKFGELKLYSNQYVLRAFELIEQKIINP